MSRYDRLSQLVDRLAHANFDALVRLDLLREIEQEAERQTASLVDAMRDAGHAWSAIGAALGVSKQAAQKRYGASVGEPVEDVDQLSIPLGEVSDPQDA